MLRNRFYGIGGVIRGKASRALSFIIVSHPDKVIRVSLRKEHKALANRIGEVARAIRAEMAAMPVKKS